ncbi:hypothetical protein A3B60_02765 [Candidatus Peregrinibacteria bacterium RIFCSPLOWO2_01_FULL_39_12]|nr:MAG: hypothetical protein A3I58_02625 [Candidatus Peregrinibacteria bacterium RIFCSPLOWO2_02_FULL_39_10]OGJ42661.1 MAG: hypothetical protein A3B60_02765 [Candidatus Peregrinibacteria bacterium RIFCSPLOWO2_01_FULL_39_12]
MEKKVGDYLLGLAKATIAEALGVKGKFPEKPAGAGVLSEKRGVFVTLEIFGQLRGCIGNILPVYPLEEAVRRNALNAAFDDPRFMPLAREEFKDVEIEISVLTVPKKLEYSSSKVLLERLQPLKDGVIFKKGYCEATYLPQVWEDLRGKEMFLSSLCTKAGMRSDEWRNGGVEVFTYQAEVFK